MFLSLLIKPPLAERPGCDPAGVLWSDARRALMLASFTASKPSLGGTMAKNRKSKGKSKRKAPRAAAKKTARKTVKRAAAKRKPARKPARKAARTRKAKPAGVGARIAAAVGAVIGTLTEAEQLHTKTAKKAGFQELE